MNCDEIKDVLTPIFREVFGDASLEVTDELNADAVENWSSLTHMIMMSEVEKAFNIRFKLKELKKLQSVGDLVCAISEKI